MKRIYAFSLLLMLAGCQTPSTYGPSVSEQELQAEAQYQQQLVEEAARKGGAPRPWQTRPGITRQFTRVAERIDKTGAEVCQDMGLPQQGKRCYYYFSLSRDTDLNAHADGKTIVMYTGMMRFLRDDDEVGIVLAHELAHNLMGHVDATQNNVMAGAVVGALLDTVAASQGVRTGGDLMSTGANMGLLSYSVEFEQEADYVGMYIAARAGYDIRKAPELWRRMTLENPKGIFRETTHPSNPRRAATLQKTIQEIEYKRKHRIPLVPDFKQDVTNL
jgi:predicted Zn-dependent protease